jgi:transketolase
VTAKLDQECINTLRFLSVDMVQKANSGYPGLPLGAAPMTYVLWTRGLRFNPHNPHWADRDRFVLSAGHGSALLYAMLHMTGYDLSPDDLRQFRQWGGKPELILIASGSEVGLIAVPVRVCQRALALVEKCRRTHEQ